MKNSYYFSPLSEIFRSTSPLKKKIFQSAGISLQGNLRYSVLLFFLPLLLSFFIAGYLSAQPFPASFYLSTLNGSNGFAIIGIDPGDFLGRSVSGAGDINGDGIDDMVIGATGVDFNENLSAGEAYVIFGRTTGFFPILDPGSLDGTNGFYFKGTDDRGRAGQSVSTAGDVNEDFIEDLIIGAPRANPDEKESAGESYVIYGSTSGFSQNILPTSLNGSYGFVIQGIDPDDYAGISVSGAGDVNGDGINDLIIGAPEADPEGLFDAGESYVVYGRTSGFERVLKLKNLDGSNGFTIKGIYPGGELGYSVSGAGDVNGDGINDLIIGAPLANPNEKDLAGISYVVFGRPLNTSTATPANAPDITLTPNPATNKVLLQSTAFLKAENTRVSLFDRLGRLQNVPLTRQTEAYQLNLQTLPSGVYLILIEAADFVTTKRLVKE